MARLSARIFGEVARPESLKSKKVVELFSKPYYHEKKEVTNLYPRHHVIKDFFGKLRHNGLYRDEHLDFVEEMERQRTARGKGKIVHRLKYEEKLKAQKE